MIDNPVMYEHHMQFALLLCTLCMRDKLHIHCDTEQDKVVTEHAWINNDIQIFVYIIWLSYI